MFKLNSEYKPTGDQPQAIEYLSNGIKEGKKFQTLLGVTGSGKTFTMANIIEKVQKPTLVLAHNKTLAGQLYSEFKEFFPENNVEYFVSYYDYYQPEAYIAASDTYIEKDASINDEIDKLRHSATLSLFETRDVIIVASVSCIYGLGDPVDYNEMMLSLRPKMIKTRDEVMKKLITMQYSRNELDFKRGTFRAKGDILEIYPSSESESAVRVEFWGDEIEKINEINPLTGKVIGIRNHILVPPASQYVTNRDKIDKAIITIEEEMKEQVKKFKAEGKLIEAQRIEENNILISDAIANNNTESVQLGLIADDIKDEPLFNYVGATMEYDTIIEPEEKDENGNIIKEAVKKKNITLGLKAIPLAVTALTACKYLLSINKQLESRIENLELKLF